MTRYSDYSGLYDDGYDDFVKGKGKKMTDKIKELLAVLDMPEEEQIQFLVDYLESSTDQSYLPDQLADLAFRLRDEVGNVAFHHCIAKVCKHINPYVMNYAGYGLCTCQPIHWIIAALCAKELAKEKNGA